MAQAPTGASFHLRNLVFTISKRFEFSASHQLLFLVASQPEHQCGRLHGHNYIVEVVLRSETLPDKAFVRDYGDLAPIKAYIDTHLDHQHLNHVLDDPSGRSTTAERLAEMLYWRFRTQFPEIHAVRVSETPKTWAEYADHHKELHGV